MFLVKMMINRIEGYKNCCYCNTLEEAKEYVNALKIYYNPIDVYYMYA